MRFLIMILAITCNAEARTLWSGSFVRISKPEPFAEIGINYPALGPGKICGIEFKSHTMILNKRVWQKISEGLRLSATIEDAPPQILDPEIGVAEGPQIFYRLKDLSGSYAVVRVDTISGENLSDFFSRNLNENGSVEDIIAIAQVCPN
jgi:hypothetical protein